MKKILVAIFAIIMSVILSGCIFLFDSDSDKTSKNIGMIEIKQTTSDISNAIEKDNTIMKMSLVSNQNNTKEFIHPIGSVFTFLNEIFTGSKEDDILIGNVYGKYEDVWNISENDMFIYNWKDHGGIVYGTKNTMLFRLTVSEKIDNVFMLETMIVVGNVEIDKSNVNLILSDNYEEIKYQKYFIKITGNESYEIYCIGTFNFVEQITGDFISFSQIRESSSNIYLKIENGVVEYWRETVGSQVSASLETINGLGYYGIYFTPAYTTILSNELYKKWAKIETLDIEMAGKYNYKNELIKTLAIDDNIDLSFHTPAARNNMIKSILNIQEDSLIGESWMKMTTDTTRMKISSLSYVDTDIIKYAKIDFIENMTGHKISNISDYIVTAEE